MAERGVDDLERADSCGLEEPLETDDEMQPKGRLELTWTNKDKALLATEDGRYQWVKPKDHRVAEVRLLRDAGEVGEVGPDEDRAKDNLLIRGDALNALEALTKLPEFADELMGKVKLIYIDPPFNTGQAFEHYDDALEHSVWLTMMRDRLVLVQDLLAPDGSIWVHLNDDEAAYAKSILDDIFGRDSFIATFIWQKVDSPSDNKVNVTSDHDLIFCYARSPEHATGAKTFHRKVDPSLVDAYGQTAKDGRKYRDRLLKKNGKNSLRKDRPKSWFPISDPDGNEVLPIHDDGIEACWALGTSGYDALLATNSDPEQDDVLIWKRRDGHFVPNPDYSAEDSSSAPPWRLLPDGERWVPYTREWAPDDPTRPWPTIWATSQESTASAMAADALEDDEFSELDPEGAIAEALTAIASLPTPDDVKTTRQAKAHLRQLFPGVTPFATPKPEQLLSRIIQVATDEDDLVFDFFFGSGSTGSTAHKLGRRWVGIERDRDTVATFAFPRLKKVVEGSDPGGITQEVGWKGGGGFRVLDIAPSMYEEDEGIVVLADWAAQSQLAEATAAQLGFEYEEEPPFCGRKGRMRLAVIDGHCDERAVRELVKALPQEERLSVCATSLDPNASDVLAKLRSGSQIRAIPEDVLLSYRTPSAWRVSVARQRPDEPVTKKISENGAPETEAKEKTEARR